VNFLHISQLSIRSGAYNLFRRFLDFSQFLTAISGTYIVAPPSDGNKNSLAALKGQSLLKRLKTELKSTHKQRHNSCSKYMHIPLERYKQIKTNTTFSHLQPTRVIRSSTNFARW